MAEEEYRTLGHITSLNPIRPENAPDPWETTALKAFERGDNEISSEVEMRDKGYLRLMRPLYTEKGCLLCHSVQGYQEGDIRGGISVSIPMDSLNAIARVNLFNLALGHTLFWLMGLGGIILGTLRLKRSERERRRAEEVVWQSWEELQRLTTHLQSAREEERTMVAEEVHDELGQNLIALKMDLSWLQRELPPGREELSDKMESVLKLVDDTIQRVKRISAELRPGLLDDLGIAAAVEWQTEEFQRVSGISCELVMVPEDLVMDKEATTVIFRVLREILSNVVQHSGASKVRVNLSAKSDWVTLEVSDNGRGIRKVEISSPTALGILGMKERISHIGGEFDIMGRGGEGTKVRVRVPLTREDST